MSHIERYYINQAGGGIGPVFAGRPQRGYGIGSLFAGLFKYAVPILKPLLAKGAKTVGRAVLKRVASQIAGNTSSTKRSRGKRKITRQTKQTNRRVKAPLNSVI